LAYFGQHSTAELQMDLTPVEFMETQFPGTNLGVLRNHLAKTGVTGGVESTRMQNLSYSQRSCVIFAKLTFISPHLLIMDEPTNFLDLESVDSLIAAANKFPGALLVVTHSRQFLRKMREDVLVRDPWPISRVWRHETS
jgi:ATP-binding cassette subfamily F protein 3